MLQKQWGNLKYGFHLKKNYGQHILNPKVIFTPLSNRFESLNKGHSTSSNNKSPNKVSKRTAEKKSRASSEQTLGSQANNTANCERTNAQTEKEGVTRKVHKNENSSKTVINLLKRKLTKEEVEVLELRLNFCPSAQGFNKEQLTTDFYWFFRRLKLREYFESKKKDVSDTSKVTSQTELDQCELDWKEKNSECYPEEVRNNRSAGLKDFMKNVLEDTKKSLNSFYQRNFNNLTESKRKALKSPANDTNIVIKPSDKCDSVVVMDKGDYERECLKQLSDADFYEELDTDPNEIYKEKVSTEINNLRDKNYINAFQKETMLSGDQTPNFYGLPKMHSKYKEYPPLRPISNGHSSCTAKLSEYLDSFLKCAAQKTKSYVRDTTDFLKKTKRC